MWVGGRHGGGGRGDWAGSAEQPILRKSEQALSSVWTLCIRVTRSLLPIASCFQARTYLVVWRCSGAPVNWRHVCALLPLKVLDSSTVVRCVGEPHEVQQCSVLAGATRSVKEPSAQCAHTLMERTRETRTEEPWLLSGKIQPQTTFQMIWCVHERANQDPSGNLGSPLS